MKDEFREWQRFAEERFRFRADRPVFAAELDHVKQHAMARLDRLGPVKEVVQYAAVLGRRISAEVVDRAPGEPVPRDPLEVELDAEGLPGRLHVRWPLRGEATPRFACAFRFRKLALSP